MLTQHSKIAGGLETHWFEIDFERWTGRKGEPLDGHLARLAAFYDIEHELVESMARNARSGSQFLDKFMAEVARQLGKPRWVEKTPENILRLDTIAAYWTNAVVVHVVRDPRDLFTSMLETNKLDSVQTFIRYWAPFFQTAQRYVQTPNSEGLSLIELGYERLVTDTRVVMKELAAAIGEPFEEAMAGFDGCSEEYHKVLQVTGVHSPTLRRMMDPLTTNRIGIWKNALTPQTVKDLGAEAARCGLSDMYARMTSGQGE